MRNVQDRVHDQLRLPQIVVDMMLSKEFCRLDRIRQLGGCHFSYPTATHTRREHSIGVAYLAGRAGRHLRELYPHMVSEDDVLCLQIAGLLHDLGHGPFSHAFEVYMRSCGNPSWSHEEMGARLSGPLLARLDGRHFFSGSVESHRAFILLLMSGLAENEPWPTNVGRAESSRFLVHVVHNRASGMDVDKFDYLLRDSMAVIGATKSLDVSRLIGSFRAVKVDGNYTLGFDDSAAFDVAEVYALRARLHRKLYQHHSVVFAETMLVQLMHKLDESSGVADRFSTKATTPEGMMCLTDDSIMSHPSLWSIMDPSTLYRWPQTQCAPSTVLMRTLPSCMRCGHETPFVARFCSQCGESTVDRMGVQQRDSARVAPECLVEQEQVSKQLMWELGRRDIVVSIQDVCCGAAMTVTDPHGIVWKTFDPIRTIAFTPDGYTVERMEAQAHMAPMVRHLRSARCFVTSEVDEMEMSRIDAAFRAWGKKCGRIVETFE